MRSILVFCAASLPALALAQEAPPGATACTGCHDPAIHTELSLDSLSAEQIVTAVAEIRSGARPVTLMNRIAAGFTDAEIEAIAAWLTRKE